MTCVMARASAAFGGAALVAFVGWSSPARSQGMSAAQLATYQGADRDQLLAAAAKKEGTLTIYSSLTTDDMAKITPAFEKKYGVKVNFWRGSSEDIRDRAIAEAKNGRHDVDVIETAGPDMVAIDAQKIFEPVKGAVDSKLIPQAFTKGQNWTGSRVTLVVGAYNTDAVKTPPKTYADLAKPIYKGDLGIEAESDWWLMALCDALGKDKTVALFKKAVAANGMSPRKGHTLLANLTASGEIPIAITTYSYKVDQLSQKGAPIKRINWDPSVALMTGIGVAAKAPHPYSALLFRDFFLGEGQGILARLDAVPVNKSYQSLPAGMHLIYVDSVQWLRQDAMWSKLYRSVFVQK